MKKTQLCEINRDRPQKQEDEEEEEEYVQKSYLHQLPNHIIVEIFCKIPTKSLIQCKRVCKSWRRWLSDPQFTKHLLSRTPPCLLVYGSKTPRSHGQFLVDLDRASVLKLFRTDPNISATHCQCIVFVGSCNGFLCHLEFHPDFSHNFYISNPVIGESLALPTHTRYPEFCGFGFSPTTDDYKVVQISSTSGGSSNVMVLTVGSQIWRNIGDIAYSLCKTSHPNDPGPAPLCTTRHGIYLNGFLYWIGRRSEGSLLICAFDIESERFKELPLPPCSLDIEAVSLSLAVTKSTGRLCLLVKLAHKNSVVWVMKNYGGKGSWTKELEIRTPLYLDTPFFNFSEEGQVLFLFSYTLYGYTRATDHRVRVEVHGLPSNVRAACAHIPSILSLEHITKGSELELEATIYQT